MQFLLLIRHATPEGDFPARYLGRTDPDLGPLGRAQSVELGRCFHPDDAVLVSSPLQRAHRTAELAFPGREVLLKPKAVEMSFGVLDGLLPETARRLYPEAWALHRRQPTRLAALGGEDWRDVEQRARQVLDELPAAPTCILVAHQLFFSALLGTIGLVPPPLGYAQTLLLQRHVGSGWRCAT